MRGLILRRLATTLPTLAAVVLLSFLLMRVAPGGPFDADRPLDPATRAALEASYGLDRPLPVQLGRYLLGLAHGDFGPSLVYRDFTVSDLVAQGLPVSLTLGGCALLLALALGLVAGIAAALRPGGRADGALMLAATLATALPTFVTGPLLVLVFALSLGWLPVSGWRSGDVDHLVLPVVALALPVAGAIAKLVRAGLAAGWSQDHVRTARARGAGPTRLVVRHMLRPALLPVASYLGPAAAALLTGAVVIETVFALPGLGRYFVQGALNRDYPLVLGVVLLYASLLLACNLAADLLYGWLDPPDARMSPRRIAAPLAVVAGIALAALLLPALLPWRYDAIDWSAVRAPPFSPGHPLGTDLVGRDLLARIAVGTRVTLAVAAAAAGVALLLGVGWGAVAGWRGGRIDEAMMRVVDALYALPFMFVVILLMVVFGRSILLVFLGIGAVEWLTMARIVRAQTMALKRRGFVLAARAAGAPAPAILLRHVVPNLAGVALAYLLLTVPQVVMVESFLSFLGLGVQEPLTSLGILVHDGADDMDVAPVALLLPGGLLVAILVCLTVAGERLRDRLAR